VTQIIRTTDFVDAIKKIEKSPRIHSNKGKNKESHAMLKQDFLLILSCCLSMVLFLSPGYTAEITLSWDRNTEKDIAGYKVLSGTNSRNYTRSIDVGNTNSCAISGLQEGITYYFAAIAYNTSGLESGFSNEVSYRVPQSMAASGSLLYADYGPPGTWMWDGSTWSRIAEVDLESMVTP